MTTITLPPFDVIRVATLTDLPANAIDGLLGVVKDTDALYVYDQVSSSWILISGSIFVSTVTDTNSVDLTVLLGNLSADVRISSNAADAGNTLVPIDIESTGVKGLRAQISNSSIRTLFSATTPITFDNTTGIIAIPVSTNAVNGYLSAADHTTFAAKVGPTRTINTTAPLTGGGDLSADRTIAIPVATTLVDGYLAAADFTTFNSKVGTARNINTTAPLQGGGNLSADRTLTITQSATAADGYLSSTDWNTFNNKVATTRSIATTAPITGGGNLSADRTIAIPKATTIADGYLASADFVTFNNKVATTVTISTTAPLTGGGDLSTNRTIAIPVATSGANGYLASTDWTIFNNKVGTARAINTTAPITGGGDLSADRTIAMAASTNAVDGYLTAADHTTFAAKVATTRAINTTAPITGGGDLSADRTIAMAASTNAVDGYLSAADHTTFNAKQAAITIGSLGAGNANGLDLTTGTLTLHAATSTQPGAVSTAAQVFAGDKTFNGSILKPTISANNSFRSLIANTGSYTSPTNLQSCSAVFGEFYSLFYVTDNGSGKAMLLSINQAIGGISVISDSGGIFLGTDAGTGIYVTKSAASMTVTVKNRTGGTTSISIVNIVGTLASMTAWA